MFLIFGGIGVFFYLASEAETYFKKTLSITFSRSLLGFLFILAGIAYKRNEAVLEFMAFPADAGTRPQPRAA